MSEKNDEEKEQEKENSIKFENIKKINNPTNSSQTSTTKTIHDIYNDKVELEKYLKENCPEFWEKFELLEFKKNGSAGAVLKAQPRSKENKKNRRFVALKFLYNGKKNNKPKKEINHQEIIIHGALKHKNIPQIYGYYKIGECNSCIAMEFSQYGDLENFKKKVIKRVPLSETFICYILGGICDAVYYMHTHNKIIHMDIKQQNIVVDDYINIKLTDYSISIDYKNKDFINLPLIGTCYYMSPEVLRKETIPVEYASKIDVYSIGVLLYFLAFCDYPFKLKDVGNKDYPQILKNVENNDLEFPKDYEISKPFLNLLKNCLNKDISKRYSIHQLINDPWTKGYQIILNEKEKLYNAGRFVIDLMVDNIINFNDYIKQIENNENFFLK
jgi:serine/threonine protein kinase